MRLGRDGEADVENRLESSGGEWEGKIYFKKTMMFSKAGYSSHRPGTSETFLIILWHLCNSSTSSMSTIFISRYLYTKNKTVYLFLEKLLWCSLFTKYLHNIEEAFKMFLAFPKYISPKQTFRKPFLCQIVFLWRKSKTAHWLKPPTLARHHSNYLHELFYDRRSW